VTPERVRPALAVALGLGASLVVFLAYTILSSTLRQAMPGWPRLTVALGQVLFLLPFAVLAMHALDRRFGARRPPIGLRQVSGAVLVGVAGVVVAFSLSLPWLLALDATGWRWVDAARDMYVQALAPLLRVSGATDVAGLAVTVVLVPAACEEAVFRAGLQRWLSEHVSPLLAIGLTATTFSAFHVEPLGFPARLFLGVSLGLAYHLTQRLLVAGLVHATNNAVTLAVLGLTGAQRDPDRLVAAGLDADLELAGAAVALGIAAAFAVPWLLALRLLVPPSRRIPAP
jgi:hypothetical protein